MKNFKTYLLPLFCLLLLFQVSFEKSTSEAGYKQTASKQSPPLQKKKSESESLPAKVVLPENLKTLGWNIPALNISQQIPVQAGSIVNDNMGKQHTIKVNSKNDLPWTAFTLVLHVNKLPNGAQIIEVLTQMRAKSRAGTIETAGGHLTSGKSWGEGALDELQQETGIQEEISPTDLIPMSNTAPFIKTNKKGRPYANVNFALVFEGGKPRTSANCSEINRKYGHKWINLDDLYLEMKEERKNLGRFKDGKYYSCFRNHLIRFYETIYPQLGQIELDLIPSGIANWNNNTYYAWGANSKNYDLAPGTRLNGRGMASAKGPSGGIAHQQYVGIIATLKTRDTLASVEAQNSEEVFPKLETLLRIPGNKVVLPINFNNKWSLGTGLAINQINNQEWCSIQKNIFENIGKLIDLGATIVPSGKSPFWPDHTKNINMNINSHQDIKKIIMHLKESC